MYIFRLGIALHPHLQPMYVETSQQIQKWIEFVRILLIVALPIFSAVLPCLTCFYAYFTTDLGNDAFELAYPMW